MTKKRTTPAPRSASPINLNSLARDICMFEDGAVNQNVAEVKEQLRITLDLLTYYRPSQVLALLEGLRIRDGR